jgi:RNA polymerase sigma-70 factor (ECF subfamily)
LRLVLATRNELSEFLAAIERRAFKQAMFAVRNDENALDIVQDSMLKLSTHYGDKPASELPMLFQRILQNTIKDHYRRQKVRSTWVSLLSSLTGKDDSDEDFDPLETMLVEGTESAETPHGLLQQSQVLAIIEEEIGKLPLRQRQAFLMRYWEDMDIAETALSMGCSEGSVKTHCSRATQTLAAALRVRGVVL